MKVEQIAFTFVFLLILLAQVLVLNHIHLFNCATPLLYVYLALDFHRNYPRGAILVVCFVAGLIVDTFSNTQGVASASMTLVGFLQPLVFDLFITRESDEEMQPTMKALGFRRYLYYSTILTMIYCLTFFTVEMFSFFNWQQWGFSIIGSFVLTEVLILVMAGVRKR